MKKLTAIFLTMILMVSLVLNVQAQNRLNEITQRGVLKVGMSGEQPPFNMEAKDGSLMGYEVDLAKLLATAMNLELELVRIPFKDLIPSLQEGKVDLVMSGMTITMERNMKVAFIGP